MNSNSESFEVFSSRINLLLALDHAGRAGNAFFQTIFDLHPEVITCPWIHYVYSYIVTKCGTDDLIDSQVAHDYWTTQSYFQWVHNDLDEAGRNTILKFGGDPDAPLDRPVIRRVFREIVLSRQTISRRDLVLATYYAIALGTGRDTRPMKYVLVTDSISLRFENVFSGFSGMVVDIVLKDFPHARIVHLIRDPRAGFASTNHQFINSLGNMYGIRWGNSLRRLIRMWRLDFNWDCIFVFGFWLMYFRRTYQAVIRKREEHSRQILTLRNEDLNLRFVPTMQRLCGDLGIAMHPDWSADSWTPTMIGRPWTGTGAYNTQYQKNKYGPLPNDPDHVAKAVTGPNAYVTQRWRKRLARNEIHLIEWFLAPELEFFGYEFLEYKPGRRQAWRWLWALAQPLRGELPTVRWILNGRLAGGSREVLNRVFYSVVFPLYYLMSRISFLRIVAKSGILL